jgi:hypothetical protein
LLDDPSTKINISVSGDGSASDLASQFVSVGWPLGWQGHLRPIAALL